MTDAKYIVIQSISTTFIGILKSLKMNIANVMRNHWYTDKCKSEYFHNWYSQKIKVSKHNAPRKPSHP